MPTSPGSNARLGTTGRVRRNQPRPVSDERLAPTAIQPAPPTSPAVPPRPLGELGKASPDQIAELAVRAFNDAQKKTRGGRRRSVLLMLGHLEGFPGDTWQQRWEASGLNDPGNPAIALGGDDRTRQIKFGAGARHLFCMRVVRPSLEAFRSNMFTRYPQHFQRIAADPELDAYFAAVAATGMRAASKNRALFDVTCALTVFGIAMKDLTPEAFLHYAAECRAKRLTCQAHPDAAAFAGVQAWKILFDTGHFPASAPHSLRAAVTKGQRTVEELIDRYQLRNKAVRDLLVDYIRRRSIDLDYSTLGGLCRLLAKNFWKTIEKINPGQQDLQLSEETYQQWKAAIATRDNGQPRLDTDSTLLAVRSMYLDLHTWAITEPEAWAQWVAPCPVREHELRWFNVRRRRINERMAERTRVRQPLLPALVEHVATRWLHLRDLLVAAQAVELGQTFSLEGVTWQRMASKYDRHRASTEINPPIRVVNRDTGTLIRLTWEEETAFWEWAIVETLRHAGLRAEELTELTHLSVRNYQRPNGEVIALLVVAPSKTDRERVIPMSAELFHVIAQVIRRHRDKHGTVPIATRYDLHEKIWSPPLPYLFQRQQGSTKAHVALSHAAVSRMIKRRCEALAAENPAFAGATFTPHDFRRLFTTELLNNGLPIHIGAALLGHLSLQTTRGYAAVFPEDVIRHYQQILERRRAQRPPGEYRDPTTQEWAEFEEHFDKRRVELGSCGRPYGTPCHHEHACIRCPMLSINPKMLPRLDEIETDLINRRDRALAEAWHGEVDGLDQTLAFLRSKRTHARRSLQTNGPTPIDLGMPAPAAPTPKTS